MPHAGVSHGSFWDHAPHVIRQRSKPNTLKSQTLSNPKHSQIQDTWVTNSHACFKETSLKILKPILQQRPQEYKIYRAPSLHFIKVKTGTPSTIDFTLNDALETVHKRHFYSFFVKFHSTRAHPTCNVQET